MQSKDLIIFGDSIAKGVTYQDGRYHLCQGHNFDMLSALGITVKNFSKMGACTDTGLAIAAKRLPSCPSGATVLLSFGGNDCDYDWQAVSDRPKDMHEPKISAQQFLENYRQLVRMAKDAGAQVLMTSLAPIDAHRYMQHISDGRSFENILSWLGDIDRLSRWQEYYSDLVCRLARELGVELLDLRTEFLKSPAFPSLISGDGIHPTQTGHDLVHSCVAQALG